MYLRSTTASALLAIFCVSAVPAAAQPMGPTIPPATMAPGMTMSPGTTMPSDPATTMNADQPMTTADPSATAAPDGATYPTATPVAAPEAGVPATAGDASTLRAPDGSRFFGFEPYIGILGGYDSFDRREDFSIGRITRRLEGAQIEGLIGVNIPIGPVFVGVEGFGAKGFAAIRWEYGVRGRAGLRIGDSGMVYGSFGRTWVEVNDNRGFRNVDDWVYGLGVEVGPRDIGLGGVTGRSGPRLRLSVESFDLKSIRPMAGIVFHF